MGLHFTPTQEIELYALALHGTMMQILPIETRTLKNNIHELRKCNKWSLNELSRLSGVPVNTIWRMERGDGVRLLNAYKVADAFNLTIYDLWDIPPSGSMINAATAGAKVKTVRELRVGRRWRLQDLAQVSGVSKAALVSIEKGHTPTLKNALRIAVALGVSIHQIWSPIAG